MNSAVIRRTTRRRAAWTAGFYPGILRRVREDDEDSTASALGHAARSAGAAVLGIAWAHRNPGSIHCKETILPSVGVTARTFG